MGSVIERARALVDKHDSISADAPVIMVVAGEASGDEHAAGVVREVSRIRPGTVFFGMGGGALRSAGVETVVDSEEVASVMGLTEVISSLPRLSRAFRLLLREAIARRPDVVVLVDLPDFNLRLASRLKRRGLRVVYFISPQLWAWRKGRVRQVRKNITKVIPIFPFEESFYHQHGVNAEYLGHPFIDRPQPDLDRDAYLMSLGISPHRPLIALLPGSRRAEIDRLLKPMLEAFFRLSLGRKGLQAVIPAAQTVDISELRKAAEGYANVHVVDGKARELLSLADAAVVASGTATLEAALAGVPFVVVYRLSPLTYAVGKMLVKGVRHIAMANLIAGKGVVEELIQHDANQARIAEALEVILGDKKKRENLKQELAAVRERLRAGIQADETVSSRVANAVLSVSEGAERVGFSKRRGID